MSCRLPDFSKVPATKDIVKSAINSKANIRYTSKKLWKELNLPTSPLDLTRPNIFSLPEKLLKHSPKLKPLKGPHEKKTRKKTKSEFEFFNYRYELFP